ncbi:hypothetical protein [Devosia sp. 2618]|uniref:hypothetical protein n=1 Tax=Devosia sp. 2618 TaxID=3156454 RepID=UPI003396513B
MADTTYSGELSLYFKLVPGEKADLEVVAQAALDWVAALRAAALEIEPTAKFRVEIVDAVEGSLRLNAILDWAEDQLKKLEGKEGAHWRVKNLAIALAVFVPSVVVPTALPYILPPTLELSEEDRSRLDALIRETSDKPPVREKRKRFFQTVERDPSIEGVGIAENHESEPLHIIPKSDFAELGGVWAILEEEEEERTVWPVLDVTLISPTLAKRAGAWRFQAPGLPEFSATMKDPRFLEALEQDHVRERLRFGIQMKIKLRVDEKKVGGIWTPKKGGRSVIEVLSPSID